MNLSADQCLCGWHVATLCDIARRASSTLNPQRAATTDRQQGMQNNTPAV